MTRTPHRLRRAACGTLTVLAMAFAAGSASAHPASTGDSARFDYFRCLTTGLVQFPGSIAEAAIQTPELSTLVTLVQAANLVGPLAAPGNLTVFAPTNAAFAKVPPALLGAIGSDVSLLTAVLTYHVSPGRFDPRREFWPREIPTLQGQGLFLSVDRMAGPQVNQSSVACKGVKATNGTVWIIDSVMLPQFR